MDKAIVFYDVPEDLSISFRRELGWGGSKQSFSDYSIHYLSTRNDASQGTHRPVDGDVVAILMYSPYALWDGLYTMPNVDSAYPDAQRIMLTTPEQFDTWSDVCCIDWRIPIEQIFKQLHELLNPIL